MKRIPPLRSRTRLDIRDLEVVLAIASAGSATAAAPVLHLTQSAVSRALRNAETKIGVELFTRTAHGLVATPAGERLVEGARDVLGTLAEVEAEVLAQPDAPERLRIVCECYTTYHWLPGVLLTLQKTMPHLTVDIALEHTDDPGRALQGGEVDLAMLSTAPAPRGIEEVALFGDRLVFLVSADHPLAARTALTADDFVETPLLLPTTLPRAVRRWFVRRVFGRARPPVTTLRLPLTEALVAMAVAGFGIAVLSEWSAEPYAADARLVRVPFVGGPLMRHWRLAFPSHRRDLALRLAAALRPPERSSE
ncbi:MAG: LysR family transcriptional regulator [Myxococcota bacterium]